MLSQNAVTANTVKKEKKEFGISDKIGYMFGDLGNCFILGLVNSFLMIYYTNVLGVSGAIVGTLFLISRILDAFADVMVGRLCDVSELTETGRFIPWIRKMKLSILLSDCHFVFAIRPTSSNDGEDCLYFCFIHCLWDFSLNNQYPVWSNGSSN